MNRVLARDFEHKLKSLQEAIALHGGDLTVSSSGVYLSRHGETSINASEAAKSLSDSTQKHYDEGGI